MIRREVVREKVVHVAGGQQYRLRQGDIVALFPLLSPQMDPEIHQDPQVATVLELCFPPPQEPRFLPLSKTCAIKLDIGNSIVP